MHAVEIVVTFNDRAAAEAEVGGLVSQVASMPGFVAGYWVGFAGDKGTAMVAFDSEDGAQALADIARNAPAGAVNTESIQVGEVIGHA